MVQRRTGDEAVEVQRAAAAAVEVATEVAGAACLVAMSRAELGAAARAARAGDLRQEERRRRREAAQAAQAQSVRRARVAEEVHWARVRAAMAAVALRKGGRRWRPSAERAVVRAVCVAGGSGTCANESRTIHAKLGPKMVTNWQGGGGGKAAKSVEYGRSYPVRTEEPVRREGATGPERPKRMRPDGAVCYVEGKNGGLGVKRRHVQQGEQPGRPPGRPPEGR